MAVPSALRGPVARPGLVISGALLGIGAVLGLLGSTWGAFGACLLATANLGFFRNPTRRPPGGEGAVVAPADGRVVEVVRLADPDGFVGDAWRVAIFLSIFDGHVQRVPLAGKVRSVRRRGTRFLAAFRSSASDRNVQTRVDVETPSGSRYAVVQITGLVARRIFCYAVEGAPLVRGEPYGLICYGSRVELYLPASTAMRVAPGDRLRAGETWIGEVQS